ncbi:MAG: hypothetical protein ACP5EP_03115 [Acidobacteriaceae bacterium]
MPAHLLRNGQILTRVFCDGLWMALLSTMSPPTPKAKAPATRNSAGNAVHFSADSALYAITASAVLLLGHSTNEQQFSETTDFR